MSRALPRIDHLHRVERALRDLIANRGAHQRGLDRHYKAEHALYPISPNDPEGNADVAAYDLDAACIRKELRTPIGVDLPAVHSQIPAALGREAARRADGKIGTNSIQLQDAMIATPQSYGVSFWELSASLPVRSIVAQAAIDALAVLFGVFFLCVTASAIGASLFVLLFVAL